MAELEDKYSRFLRQFNIDIETIEENAESGGTSDHGELTGLADDDHTQYHNNTRGDARYYTKAQIDATLGDYALEVDLNAYRPVSSFARYGYKTGSTDIDCVQGTATLGDIFYAKVFVPSGMAINKIGTIVKTAGIVGAGGLNGFAIWSEDGQTQIFTSSTNNQWTSNGDVSVNLGGSAIAAQPTDKYYICAFASKGYSTPPVMLFNILDSVLTDGPVRRSWYSGDSAWPATLNPATHGNPASGYVPLIMLG